MMEVWPQDKERGEGEVLGGCAVDSWVVQLSLNMQAIYSWKESALRLHPGSALDFEPPGKHGPVPA